MSKKEPWVQEYSFLILPIVVVAFIGGILTFTFISFFFNEEISECIEDYMEEKDPIITFSYAEESETIGTLYWNGSTFSFDGDAEESAEMFLYYLNNLTTKRTAKNDIG